MPVIEDEEFGPIAVKRVSRQSHMRATIAPNGSLRLSVPSYAPIFMIKRMIAGSRPDLRRLLDTRPKLVLGEGMAIGKSHTLHIRTGKSLAATRIGNRLILTLGPDDSLDGPAVIETVRSQMQQLLRREAKHHLPLRIRHIAHTFGFSYTSLRFTHASTRWGSCNHKKAISLNIALMNLPFELIDYVLIHELAHTVHLDHSKSFWAVVEAADPDYKRHRKLLKTYNPGI